MKKQPFTLDREFIKWFFEQEYPDTGSNRSMVFSFGNPMNKENRDYWMRQAFLAGARSMAQETTDVMADWACAVEGLDPEMLEPCEVYDRARHSLFVYNTQILSKANA